MPKEIYSEEQIFVEFDFRVKINSDEKNDFDFIKDKISQINYRYYTTRPNAINRDLEFSNIPYLILKSYFDRHFRFLGQGKAYLTNYTEKQGSYIMDFTILIIQSALGYGGIRETINFFVDDLEHLFKGSLPNDFKTKVSYTEKRKFNKRDKALVGHLISSIEPLERKIFNNRIVIGVTLFFLILGLTYILNFNDRENYVTKDEYESNIINEQTNRLKDTKIEVYINDRVNDTIK